MTSEPPISPRASGLNGRRTLIALAAWALGALVFFRAPVFSGFRWMTGELGDWRLNIFLLEHWRLVFEGGAPWPWRAPPLFHPAAGTLALHDPDFGLAVPFALLRWAGCDPYLAFQLVVMACSLAGFLAFAALALRVAGCSFALALFGAAGFVFSNMSYVKLGHPNYAPVPLLAALALVYARALEALPRSALHANLAGLAGAAIFGLVAITCFQIAWYGALLAAAAMIVAALTARAPIAAALARVGAGRLAGFAALQALALALALLPFAAIFAAFWASDPGRPYWVVLSYAARPLDLFNVGSGNMLWGRLVLATGRMAQPDAADGEFSLAQTPIVAAAFVILLWWLWRRRADADLRARAIIAAGIAAIVLAPFAFKIGTASGWWLLRGLVPGATAIRTPYRLQLVLALAHWLAIVAGAGLLRRAIDDAFAAAAPHLRAAALGAMALVGALMLVEQVNLATVAFIDRPAELARTARVAPAPPECRAFFARSAEPGRSRFAVQTDAMLLAVRERIPTLNGVSGSFPEGWDLLDVHGAGYPAHVAAWVNRHGIGAGLCELALPAGTWRPWAAP